MPQLQDYVLRAIRGGEDQTGAVDAYEVQLPDQEPKILKAADYETINAHGDIPMSDLSHAVQSAEDGARMNATPDPNYTPDQSRSDNK